MLEEIIKKYPSKSAFCKDAGISPQFLSQIESGKRPIPPKLVNFMYLKHGISRHKLRPDIYHAPDD